MKRSPTTMVMRLSQHAGVLHDAARLVLLAFALASAWLEAAPAHAEASEQCASAYEDAQLFRMRGHYVEAKDALLVCLSPSCPKLLRGDCLAWLPEVEESLPSVVFAVFDTSGRDVEGARIYVDGKLLEGEDGRARSIDPGVYTLRIEAPGYRAEEIPLTIREGEKNRMVKALLARADGARPALPGAPGVTANPVSHKPQRKLHIPTLTYVLGGSALLGFGVMTALAVVGKREHDDLERTCSPNCSEESTERGRRAYIAADVFLGVSLGLTAGAVWSYFAGRDRAKSKPPELSLGLGRHGASVGYGLRF